MEGKDFLIRFCITAAIMFGVVESARRSGDWAYSFAVAVFGAMCFMAWHDSEKHTWQERVEREVRAERERIHEKLEDARRREKENPK